MFLRFINASTTGKVLPHGNTRSCFTSDLISKGFETKGGNLSIYEFNDNIERDRIIANFEIIKGSYSTVSEVLKWVEFDVNFLNGIPVSYKQTTPSVCYDTVVGSLHYDIIGLNSIDLAPVAFDINNLAINKIEEYDRTKIRKAIMNSVTQNFLDQKLINREKFIKYYKEKIL